MATRDIEVYFGGSGDGLIPRVESLEASKISTDNSVVSVIERLDNLENIWITPEDHGANGTNDGVAWQAMLDESLNTGIPWRASGEYSLGGASLNVYTSGDASAAIINDTADADRNPTINVLPLAVNKFHTNDTAGSPTKIKADAMLSAINAAIASGSWKKGVQLIPGLAAYKGHTIRINTSTKYLSRSSNATDYRYDMTIEVVDDEGHLLMPLPFDIPTDITMANCFGQVIAEKIIVGMPSILIGSGTADRGIIAEVSRSNTVITSCEIVNNTAFTLSQGITFPDASSVAVHDLTIRGTNESTTQYGIGLGASCGITFYNPKVSDCRRDYDSTYGHGVTFFNPFFPDGMGGHLTFNTKIFGGYIGCNAPNTSPIHIAGGDFMAIGTTFSRETVGSIFVMRGDSSEFIGQIILDNCDMTWDYSGLTGVIDANIVNFNYPNSTHDFGRDLVMPDFVRISGTARVLGTGHSARLGLFVNEQSRNDGHNIYYDTSVFVENLKLVFENGNPTGRVVGVRKTNWTGPGIHFVIRNLPDLTTYWGAISGNPDPTAARATWDVDVEGVSSFRTDPEATHRYLINTKLDPSVSGAANQTTLVGDEEWWEQQYRCAPRRSMFVQNGGFFSFKPVGGRGRLELYEANRALWANVLYDCVDGSPYASILDSSGAETFTGGTGTLSGAQAANSGIHIRAEPSSDRLWIENQSGSNASIRINIQSI